MMEMRRRCQPGLRDDLPRPAVEYTSVLIISADEIAPAAET
jgi:hypothetical protein